MDACHLAVGVVDAAQRDLLDHAVGHQDRGLAGAVQHVDAPGGVRVSVGLGVVGLPDVVREERLLLHGRVPVVRDEEPVLRFLHLLEAPVDPLRVLGRVDGGGGPAPSRTSRAAPSPSTRGPRGRGVARGATPPKSAAPPSAAPSRASRAPRTRSTRPVGRARPLGQPYERPPGGLSS